MPATPPVSSRLKSRRARTKDHMPTNALLERKRQTDRESQRVVRERTKKYIAHLENLVDTLQNRQQDERLQRMTIQCEKLHEENSRLRNALTSITRTIRGVEMLNFADYDYNETQSPRVLDGKSCFMAYTSSSYSNMQSPIQPLDKAAPDFQTQLATSGISPVFEASDTSASPYGSEDTHVFMVINNLISKADKCSISSIEPDKDADIAIRAVTYGWPQAEQECELDPAWQIIRQIDQDIFFCCGPVEKLGILRIVRLKILEHMEGSNKEQIQTLLPPYMHTRPAFRDFLILKAEKNPSNKISAAFASSIRFLWPFDLSDTWTVDRHTGLFSFSKLFEDRFNDISSWALAPDFFEYYPELIGYVPSSGPIGETGCSQKATIG